MTEHTTLDSLKQCYDSTKRNMERYKQRCAFFFSLLRTSSFPDREEQRLRQGAETALLTLKAEMEDFNAQKPLISKHNNHTNVLPSADEKENSSPLPKADISTNNVTKNVKRASTRSRQHKHETIMPGGFSITSTTPVAKRRAATGIEGRRVLVVCGRRPLNTSTHSFSSDKTALAYCGDDKRTDRA